MTQSPEGRLKKKIKEYLKQRGAAFFPIPGGAYGMEGAPDYVVCYKGRFVAVEGKTYSGTQSEVQKGREAWILEAGGIYVLARNVDSVREALDEIDKEEERDDPLRPCGPTGSDGPRGAP